MKPSLVLVLILFLSCQRTVRISANKEIDLSFDLGKLSLYIPNGLDSFRLENSESCTVCDSKENHIWTGDRIINWEFINQNMEREVGVPAEILIFDQPKGMECNFNDSPDLKYTLLSLEKISSQNDPKRVILDSGTFELEQTQLVYFIQQRIIDSLNWFESELVIFIEGYRLGLTYQAIDIKQESFLARSDSLLRSISITTTNSSSKTNASDSVNLKGNASNEASE